MAVRIAMFELTLVLLTVFPRHQTSALGLSVMNGTLVLAQVCHCQLTLVCRRVVAVRKVPMRYSHGNASGGLPLRIFVFGGAEREGRT